MNREKLSAAGEIWRRFLYIVVEFIYGIKCKNLSKIAEMKIITINMRFYLINHCEKQKTGYNKGTDKKFRRMEVNKMLCQFTVKNFKSIRDEVTFDMQAAAISEHEDRIIKDTDGELYLPVSAVYGPNGGGKTNVLEALHSLVTKVLRPLYATSNSEETAMKMKKVVIEPFAFDKKTRNEPTEFELFFRTTMAEYRYELTVKKEVIEYERLDRIKLETGRKSALFERDKKEISLINFVEYYLRHKHIVIDNHKEKIKYLNKMNNKLFSGTNLARIFNYSKPYISQILKEDREG
mgnify:CR=1 FL=1